MKKRIKQLLKWSHAHRKGASTMEFIVILPLFSFYVWLFGNWWLQARQLWIRKRHCGMPSKLPLHQGM
ncbi:hypothetical protein [Lihuaxuella thermophila]|uniref:TadE-like protein n=1 Tax=Lihuaxuella thermophila TaxID=1173111 RepID=A0A1H8HRE1_9BACL|nr:hypothetical protein [Lihuaxuella thermophila]SEN58629.1 hypothetical protein SAMN05444955_1154 [Lihuaxuella thermophila]